MCCTYKWNQTLAIFMVFQSLSCVCLLICESTGLLICESTGICVQAHIFEHECMPSHTIPHTGHTVSQLVTGADYSVV